MERPSDQLDRLVTLRVAGEFAQVERLVEEMWTACSEGRLDSHGLAAACQVAFLAASAGGRTSDAILWRARACSAAVQVNDLHTMAMLLVPFAFNASAAGDTEAALQVMVEVGRLADLIEKERDGHRPGVSLTTIRRVQYEKAGYLLWRAERYDEALRNYRLARPYAVVGTRDSLRLDAGEFLCELGCLERSGSPLDPLTSADTFRRLADVAAREAWLDIDVPLRSNADALLAGLVTTVQRLRPVEIET